MTRQHNIKKHKSVRSRQSVSTSVPPY